MLLLAADRHPLRALPGVNRLPLVMCPFTSTSDPWGSNALVQTTTPAAAAAALRVSLRVPGHTTTATLLHLLCIPLQLLLLLLLCALLEDIREPLIP
jgi:hypothetical protein